ncbi:hypothetical protein VNI00_000723 [Paramarasmius palmivorus]|uniref:F-box domain-containing protein n=1 Tax=Paramarasmius palmivorus TaxID=297713 RepID=A0AAW0EBS3_9AGAR
MVQPPGPPTRKTLMVQERQGRFPAEIWDRSLQELDSSSLGSVRLVNTFFRDVATRLFFRWIVLRFRPGWRVVRFMSEMLKQSRYRFHVRELELCILTELDLTHRVGCMLRGGLKAMPNLTKLTLTLSRPDRWDTHSHMVPKFLSSVHLRRLEELSYQGDLCCGIEEFASRHASTLKKLELDADAPPGYISTSAGPPFAQLYEATAPSASIGFLAQSGMPLLKKFELLYFDDMQTTLNALVVLASNKSDLEELRLSVVGLGEAIFVVVAQHFPRLRSLIISCNTEFGAFHAIDQWSDVLAASGVLRNCAKLTELVSLDWSNGYYGRWDRGWELLLKISHGNPNLDYITLPDSGMWQRVHKAFWVPSYLDPNEPKRLGYRWLVDSILRQSYSCLPSLLAVIKAKLDECGNNLESEVHEPGSVIESLKQGPLLSSAVYDLLQLGRDLKLY